MKNLKSQQIKKQFSLWLENPRSQEKMSGNFVRWKIEKFHWSDFIYTENLQNQFFICTCCFSSGKTIFPKWKFSFHSFRIFIFLKNGASSWNVIHQTLYLGWVCSWLTELEKPQKVQVAKSGKSNVISAPTPPSIFHQKFFKKFHQIFVIFHKLTCLINVKRLIFRTSLKF